MTIQQLEYFLSCASLLSFNKAAKVHYTSPSTITRQVASLEQELGVKLFDRSTHKVTVTEPGKHLFFRVQTIIGEVSQYRDSLVTMGHLPPEQTPRFRIASYTSDGMYRKLVDILQAFPSDWLEKPYSFIFPKEGEMLDAVSEGAAIVGIDSAEALRRCGSEYETKLLHRSPFRLLVGREHPLYGRAEISITELLARYPRCGDYLPPDVGALAYGQSALGCAEDLRALGEFTISRLPQIMPILGRGGRKRAPMDNMMLLLPQELELFDFIHFHSVRLPDAGIHSDYMLFWRKGSADPDLGRFLAMLDYDAQGQSAQRR